MIKKLISSYCYIKLRLIKRELSKRKNFSTLKLDKEIKKLSSIIFKKIIVVDIKVEPSEGVVGSIVTELYSTGGHTPCVMRFMESISQDYSTSCLITKPRSNINIGGDNLNSITNVIYSKYKKTQTVNNIVSIFEEIKLLKISVLFFFVDKNDMVSAVLLAMLRDFSSVKLIIYNQADHFPYLGAVFSHLVLDFRPESQKITLQERLASKSKLIPLQCGRIEDSEKYSNLQLDILKREIGIPRGNFFTITGCSSYKVMNDNDLGYFKFIKEILLDEPKLTHVIMSDFSRDELLKVEKLFLGSDGAYQRLIFKPLVPDYEIYFQACDLFIDSFPVGSALTHINMMSFKKPTVVKINDDQPLYSFEHYLPDNYPYVSNTVEGLKVAIKKLLLDEEERERVGEELYDFYIKTYDFDAVKNIYKEIIIETLHE